MQRNTTVLLVGALVAVLAIGALAPVVSAHGGTDTDEPASTPDVENTTDAHALYMAEWMTARMGPEGVDAFENETGTTVETVAQAMTEHMDPQDGSWNQTAGIPQYGPESYNESRASGGVYGFRVPGGVGYAPGVGGEHGPGEWAGYGPGIGNGYGPGMMAGYGPGMMAGYGPGMMAGYGPGMMAGYGPGMMAGYGPGMGAGYGPGMGAGYGPGMWAGYGSNLGYGTDGASEPGYRSPGSDGYGNGTGGHGYGMGGHGHGMGGGW